MKSHLHFCFDVLVHGMHIDILVRACRAVST